MVNARQIRRFSLALRALRVALVCTLPLVALIAWYTMPTPIEVTAAVEPTPPLEPVENKLPDLAWYAPLWERDLKQSPIPPRDPPVPAQAKEVDPVPMLLATLVEPEGRFAHFSAANGRAEMKTLNETIQGYVVRTIEPGRVQLEQGERIVWVELPKSP